MGGTVDGAFTDALLIDGGKRLSTREIQTVYGMARGATGVSLAGSSRSSLLQKNLLLCLAARYCHREEAFLA